MKSSIIYTIALSGFIYAAGAYTHHLVSPKPEPTTCECSVLQVEPTQINKYCDLRAANDKIVCPVQNGVATSTGDCEDEYAVAWNDGYTECEREYGFVTIEEEPKKNSCIGFGLCSIPNTYRGGGFNFRK